MADFSDGVSSYIKGSGMIVNYFPVDLKGNADISCYQCKYFGRNSGACLITREVTPYPQRYVGSTCPLSYLENIDSQRSNIIQCEISDEKMALLRKYADAKEISVQRIISICIEKTLEYVEQEIKL